jgi:hypothetical protein
VPNHSEFGKRNDSPVINLQKRINFFTRTHNAMWCFVRNRLPKSKPEDFMTRVEDKKRQNHLNVKHWELIANRLSQAGWSWGWVSAVDSEGRTIWIVDAHGYGKRFHRAF